MEAGYQGAPPAATHPLTTDSNEYAYRQRASMIRGYSQPQPEFASVHEDRPVLEKTERYHYHGPFRKRFSDNYPKVKLNLIVTMIVLLIVVIIGAVLWGIQAGETCPPLTPHGYCPPNQLMLDIGVGMALLGAGALVMGRMTVFALDPPPDPELVERKLATPAFTARLLEDGAKALRAPRYGGPGGGQRPPGRFLADTGEAGFRELTLAYDREHRVSAKCWQTFAPPYTCSRTVLVARIIRVGSSPGCYSCSCRRYGVVTSG